MTRGRKRNHSKVKGARVPHKREGRQGLRWAERLAQLVRPLRPFVWLLLRYLIQQLLLDLVKQMLHYYW